MNRDFERMGGLEFPQGTDQPVGLRLWCEMIQSTRDQIRTAIGIAGIAVDDRECHDWYVEVLFGAEPPDFSGRKPSPPSVTSGTRATSRHRSGCACFPVSAPDKADLL